MSDLLKSLAVNKLKDAMESNSLSDGDTAAAAEQGSSAIMNLLTENAGNLGAINSLFSNDRNATEDNGIFQNVVGKLSGVLQEKGMSAEAAQSEASNIAPDLINGLKDKFLSNDSADSGFDLGNLGSMLGGDAGDMLNKAKDLF